MRVLETMYTMRMAIQMGLHCRWIEYNYNIILIIKTIVMRIDGWNVRVLILVIIKCE